MAHEVETMFSARETPWHRIGVVTEDVLTAEDAIVKAGLDWTVEKRPIFKGVPIVGGAEDGGLNYVPVPNRFALERNTDGLDLAVVSDVYRPFQNTQAFSFMDHLVGENGAHFETAGSLRHGRVIFVTMKMPAHIMIGGDDRVDSYLLLRNTHDGSGRISVYVVMVRVVCMNTLTWAVNGASHQWGITHTADVSGKIAQAREALDLTFKYDEAFQKEADRLLQVTVGDDLAVELLESLLPVKAKRDDEIEAIMENWRSSENIANVRNTGWGFLNAFTEHEEHGKDNRSGEALFTRTLDGKDAKARTTLKNRLLARV